MCQRGRYFEIVAGLATSLLFSLVDVIQVVYQIEERQQGRQLH